MSDTNATLGMVPCRKGCRCNECVIERLRAEIEQLKKVAAASEKLRYLMHIKGFEGTEECGTHLDLLDAMHDAGLPCAAKGRDRETTVGSHRERKD